MNRIFIIALVAIFAALTDTSRGASGTFSGRIWNDINRDGIQDVGEPPMSNFPIYVYNENLWWCNGCVVMKTNFTDANGNYDFSHVKTNNVCNYPGICGPPLDNSFFIDFTLGVLGVKSSSVVNIEGAILGWYGDIYVTNDNVVITNHDVGLFYWNVGVSLDVAVTNAPNGSPYYVTNGTKVTYSYHLVNTGETHLSQVIVTDNEWLEFIGTIDCPARLDRGYSASFSEQRIIYESVTNIGTATALPVDPLRCDLLPTYDPFQIDDQFTIIVVTNPVEHVDGDVFPNRWEMQYGFDPLNSNSPTVNSDSDWMSNYEEFIAGTNPTNGASYFSNAGLTEDYSLVVTPSITNRVYNIWRSTNLLGEPPEWSLQLPEQTGTGSAVFFTIPVDESAAHFRTGVRLP